MDDFFQFFFGCLWYAILIVLPGGALALLLHFLISVPMRRRDRAMLFLDLVETALDRGQTLDRAIVSAAGTRDHAPGVGFYLLAAEIQNGVPFEEALPKVRGFLPPQMTAMIGAAGTLGEIRKVLPACREVARVPPDTVRTTVHYMVAILLLFAPVASFMIWLTAVFVVPRFRDVAEGSDAQLWPVTRFVFDHTNWFIGFEAIVFVGLMIVAAVYIGGPGCTHFLKSRSIPLLDWISWRLPWKRKMLQRTFSAMLAVLLDGGVPEPDAVRLAGDCTANEICGRKCRRIIAALQQGAKLDEALRCFDDSGELHWRLRNAAHARGGFLSALRGWHEALDAKAFQLEETATHVLMSSIVILNGVLVALFATAIFGVLIAILNSQMSL